MTNEQINKRLHELMGMCQHEWYKKAMSQDTWVCSICKIQRDAISLPVNIDFTTSWEGFGLLWTWLQKHELWEEFCEWYDIDGHPSLYTIDLISPPALSRAVVDFFEEVVS